MNYSQMVALIEEMHGLIAAMKENGDHEKLLEIERIGNEISTKEGPFKQLMHFNVSKNAPIVPVDLAQMRDDLIRQQQAIQSN